MGCDIHGYMEIKQYGFWEAIKKLDDMRSYDFFGILADVRNYLNAIPMRSYKGIPNDICSKTQEYIDSWNNDGHSHGWVFWKSIEEYDWEQEFMDGRIKTFNKKTGELIKKATYTNPDFVSENYILKYTPTKAKTCIKGDIKLIFALMKKWAHELGSNKVRLVFWFDN